MRAAFNHTQPQNTGVALERVNSTEQGRDMRGLVLSTVLQSIQCGFHRIQGLLTVIGEQFPDFVHFARHNSPVLTQYNTLRQRRG